jgi:hypothetical protein
MRPFEWSDELHGVVVSSYLSKVGFVFVCLTQGDMWSHVSVSSYLFTTLIQIFIIVLVQL